MSKQLREFQSRKSTLVKEARALTDRVAFENRDMTDDEVAAFDALRTRIDAASAAIDREAALIADEARIGIASAVGPTIADAMLDRLMQKHHRFTLTGDSLRQKPKTIKKEPNTETS